MAGILKCDQVQSDSNLAFAIAGSNVAFMNATSLQMVGSNVSLAGTNVITNGKLVTSGMPIGAVLQVVNATRAGATVSTTSTSDVSWGATASITPTSSSSKIYVIASGGWYLAAGTATEYAIGIQRNGATIPTAGNDGLTCVYGTGPYVGSSYVITILDTPATTSSTTYLVVAHNINSGTSAMANGVRATQLSEITLMEIAA
jgi:hypothetical protein